MRRHITHTLYTIISCMLCNICFAADKLNVNTKTNAAITTPIPASASPTKAASTSGSITPSTSSIPVTQPPTVTGPVDCLYRVSGNTVSDLELSRWAQYAAQQSFDYSFDKIDAQLQKLKPCFTEQGWTGFNEALKQSGNLGAIKSQQLTVSSQIVGQPEINNTKPNQWRIVIPLDVVYQNTKEKLSQSLSVILVVTKKSASELGIVQLIAAPKTGHVAEKTDTGASKS